MSVTGSYTEDEPGWRLQIKVDVNKTNYFSLQLIKFRVIRRKMLLLRHKITTQEVPNVKPTFLHPPKKGVSKSEIFAIFRLGAVS